MSFEHLDDPQPFSMSPRLRAGVRDRSRVLRRRRRTGIALASVASVFVLILGAGAAFGLRQAGRVQRVDTAESLTPAAGLDEPFTVLAVGVDGFGSDPLGDDEAAAERPITNYVDTILLVRIDPVRDRASIVSVPRDLWVTPPDGIPQRINGVFAQGGAASLIDTVESTFGIAVNHFAQIDMAGLRDLADEVGGLRVDLPRALRDRNSGFDAGAGCQRLDGAAVLALARARRIEFQPSEGQWVPDPHADLSRMARQRVLLLASLQGLQQASFDPLSLDDVLGAVLEHTVVDSELSLTELVDVARFLGDLPLDAVDQGFVPVVEATKDGASVLEVAPGYETAVQEMLDGSLADDGEGTGVPAPAEPGQGPAIGDAESPVMGPDGIDPFVALCP